MHGERPGLESSQIMENLLERAAAKDNHTSILTAGSPLPRKYAVCRRLRESRHTWDVSTRRTLEGDEGIDELAGKFGD